MKNTNKPNIAHTIYEALSMANKAIAFVERFLLIIILVVMIGVSVAQIILRNFFHTGLFSGELIARHLVLWVCFLGASLTTYNRHHIKIDIVNRMISKKIEPWISSMADLFAAIICLLLGNAGYTFLMDEFHYGGTLMPYVARWQFTLVIPIWFYIIAGRFFLRVYEDILKKD